MATVAVAALRIERPASLRHADDAAAAAVAARVLLAGVLVLHGVMGGVLEVWIIRLLHVHLLLLRRRLHLRRRRRRQCLLLLLLLLLLPMRPLLLLVLMLLLQMRRRLLLAACWTSGGTKKPALLHTALLHAALLLQVRCEDSARIVGVDRSVLVLILAATGSDALAALTAGRGLHRVFRCTHGVPHMRAPLALRAARRLTQCTPSPYLTVGRDPATIRGCLAVPAGGTFFRREGRVGGRERREGKVLRARERAKERATKASEEASGW